jgi:hypothetical protein
MTRSTYARVAGFTFLIYIVMGVASLLLMNFTPPADDMTSRLASFAAHAQAVRTTIVLSLLTCFTAFILAVSLYGITREEDHELAVLVLACRVAEGLLNSLLVIVLLGLLWLGSAQGIDAPDPRIAAGIGAFLRKMRGWETTISAMFFAVGSTTFSYLLLRGRMVPVPLSWLGIIGSALLIITLPLHLVGFSVGSADTLFWLPILLFEVTISFWFILKGVTPASEERTAIA